MKKFLILITLSSYFQLFHAQNYYKPLANSTTHYYSSQYDLVVSLRFDSTAILGDTLRYYPFKMIRILDYLNYESTLDGSHWVGKQIDVINDSIHLFYNRTNNPITIHSNANLSDSMVIYDNFPPYRIWATVTSFQEESFLGINDSVKTYILQAKDTSGIDIASVWNGAEIKLSKNYGYISVLNFYQFPEPQPSYITSDYGDYFNTLEIYGMENPDIGNRLLTFYDMFNFSINDEVHDVLATAYVCDTINTVCRDTIVYVKKIYNLAWLDSTILEYTQSRCVNHKRYRDGVLVTETITADTTVGTFYADNYLWGLSFEPLYNNNYYTYIIHRTNSLIESNMYFTDNYSGTLDFLQYDPLYKSYYYNGVGGPYYYSQFTTINHKYLLYYKNDSIEWGTPYECVVNIDDIFKETGEITAFPNPVSTALQIEGVTGNDLFYSIVSTTGEHVKKGKIINGDLNVSDLKPGLYVLSILADNRIKTIKFIKK